MFGRVVSHDAPRAPYVCLQCRCNIHTTRSLSYPRNPLGSRATSARPSRPANADRAPFASRRNTEYGGRPSGPPSPRQFDGNRRDLDRSAARESFSRDRNFRNSASSSRVAGSETNTPRFSPKRAREDDGPRSYPPKPAARPNHQRSSRDEGYHRPPRQPTRDRDFERSTELRQKSFQPSPRFSRDDNTRRASRGSSGRFGASSDKPERPGYLSRDEKEDRKSTGFKNVLSFATGTTDPANLRRLMTPENSRREMRPKNLTRSINSRVRYERENPEKKERYARSINSRVRYEREDPEKKERYARGSERAFGSGMERSNPSRRTPPHEFPKARQLGAIPPVAVRQPIGRNERKNQLMVTKLDWKVRALKKVPHKLHKEKKTAERWKNLVTELATAKAPPTQPSNSPPRGLAARVLEGTQSQTELGPESGHSYERVSAPIQRTAFTPETFATYKSTTPPTFSQLTYANRFFTTGTPSFLFSSSKFRELPLSSVPEVVFIGRSNVGKSSLLNALLHRTGVKLANVSSKPGRTRTMNAFGVGGEGGVRWAKTTEGEKPDGSGSEEVPRDMWVGKGGLVVLDMPGYGKASREAWGKEISKYLYQRKQLRRTFVLIDAEHGIKSTDHQILSILRQNSVPHQIIVTKVDKLGKSFKKASDEDPAKLLETANAKIPDLSAEILRQIKAKEEEEGRGGVKVLEDVICCSSEYNMAKHVGHKIGVEGVRWAVLAACGLECDEEGRKKIVDMESFAEGAGQLGWQLHGASPARESSVAAP